MAPSPLIALLTDFGSSDPFVGIVKGVIAQIAPGAQTIDLTHEIPPGDIQRAAIILWQSAPYFPEQTIFLAVVDPGVGTARRPLLLKPGPGPTGTAQVYIGPDNGLFTYVMGDHFQAWELANPAYRLSGPSATFHGRDIFAPAAAYLAQGIEAEAFGPAVRDPIRLPYPRLEVLEAGIIAGEILFADRFGNLLTSLGVFERTAGDSLALKPWTRGASERRISPRQARLILPDGSRLPLVETFQQIPPGQTAALVGSSGLLEIAANRQSAARLLALKAGDEIRLEPGGEPRGFSETLLT